MWTGKIPLMVWVVWGGMNGLATLATLCPLPETRAASTPSGGRHYWFRHIVGGRNRTKLAPGLEWFSDGKLVVVPPAPGRAWICEAEIAEAPDWLRTLVLTSPHHAHDHTERRDFPGPYLSPHHSWHARCLSPNPTSCAWPLGKSCRQGFASQRRPQLHRLAIQ